MNKLLLTIVGIYISLAGYSQKLEQLKKSSDSHNSGSNNRSGSGGSGYSNSGGFGYSNNSSCGDDCISIGCNSLFDMLGNISSNKNQPASTNNVVEQKEKAPRIRDPFEKLFISVRGSVYPGSYFIWVPEITSTVGDFSFSARLLSITEQDLHKKQYYNTFDFQPLQFNFVNTHNFLFKVGIGGMLETYSSRVYFEMTTNSKWRIGKKIDMGVEGRLALDNNLVREEASFQANYALWQKENKQLVVGINGMISEYYQSLDFNTFSISTGFRF